jgi:hypothetical protein
MLLFRKYFIMYCILVSAWKVPLKKEKVHIHVHFVKKELNLLPFLC